MPCAVVPRPSSSPSLKLESRNPASPGTLLILAKGIHSPCSGDAAAERLGIQLVVTRQRRRGSPTPASNLKRAEAQLRPWASPASRPSRRPGKARPCPRCSRCGRRPAESGAIARAVPLAALGHRAERIAREAAVGAGVELRGVDVLAARLDRRRFAADRPASAATCPPTGTAKTSVTAPVLARQVGECGPSGQRRVFLRRSSWRQLSQLYRRGPSGLSGAAAEPDPRSRRSPSQPPRRGVGTPRSAGPRGTTGRPSNDAGPGRRMDRRAARRRGTRPCRRGRGTAYRRSSP